MTSISGIARWEAAVERVHQRVRRVAAILDQNGIAYQIVGGLAVAEWVGQVDEDAVRATRDVDVSIRPEDLDRVRTVLESAGYRYKEVFGVKMLLEPDARKAQEAIHVLLAGGKVRPEYAHAVPLIPDHPPRPSGQYAVVELADLLRMKLTSYRLKDKVHILDLLGVGLITPEIEQTLPPDLLARLQYLKEHPDD